MFHRRPLLAVRRMIVVAAGPPPAGTTLDNANKGPNIVLSDGDLTAMVGPGQDFSADTVRSTTSKSTGRWIFEYTVNAMNGGSSNAGAGLCNASADLSSVTGGTSSMGMAGVGSIFQLAGGFYMNNAGMAGAVGDTWQFALNCDDGLLVRRKVSGTPSSWYGVYTGGVADPVTGTNGLDIEGLGLTGPWFACVHIQHSVDSVTACFEGADFIGDLPTGYSAWNG
jgi:hypothetical protein